MYSNEFSANEKHYKRSITITDDNEVIISEFSSNIDCERDTLQTETKKKYQSVAILKLGGGRFAQCTDGNRVDWYNLLLCCKCLEVTKGENVRVEFVAGDTYFKVIDEDERFASIYDQTGTLPAKEEEPTIIDVVFSACGACLQKTDSNGKKTLYNFEGYLAG